MLHRFYVPLATCTRVPALADDPFVTPDDLYAALHAVGIGFTITERARAAAPAPDDTASGTFPLSSILAGVCAVQGGFRGRLVVVPKLVEGWGRIG